MALIIERSNRTIGMLLLFFLFSQVVGGAPIQAQTDQPSSAQIELLLSRLSLDLSELESVSNSRDDPDKAIHYLLNYYKKRIAVKHPIDKNSDLREAQNQATEKDFIYASDALNHIFVGQPAYPPHFCGDDINWNSRPVSDKEWVWQLNRMYFWNSMSKVYAQTQDEKYATAWAEQLIDWTIKNPRDEEHKYAWRSIEAGIRGYSWTGLFQRFVDSPHFTTEVLVAFLNSCYDHAEYLMTVYRSGSNWGLMEAEGMAFIAMTFPEFKDSNTWRDEAFRRLNREINIQVYPDGHQRELAMGYHLGCIRWFLRTYEFAKLNKLDDEFSPDYLKMVEKMCEVPMKLCMPDGTNVQFGDAWIGTPGQHNEKFLEWSKLFDREDFLFLATGGAEGKKPDSTAYALPQSGLYSMRSAWNTDAICLVLKCGPDGGGHCQPDNGTFDLYAGGRNLMPDGGSYIYSGNPEGRTWFRQTKVHQTLTLDGKNSKYAPKLLLWKPGADMDILVVENDSYESLTHRRSVFFVNKRYFVLVDEAFGSADGDIGLHFQFAPGKADLDSKHITAQTEFQEGWNVLVKANRQKGLSLIEEEGQVSFEYTKKMSRPAFGFHMKKITGKSVRFITLVAPFEKEIPDVKIKMTGKVLPGSKELQLQLKENGRKKIIGYSL